MKKRGFTLIELLVAVTVFAIITSGLYQTLAVGLKLWKQGQNVAEENQRARIFFNMVTKDLKNAVFYPGLGWEWTQGEMNFPAIVPAESESAAYLKLCGVSYAFDEASGKILRREMLPGTGADNADFTVVIAAGIEEMNFAFAPKPSSPAEDYIWQDIWEKSDVLPRAVKISLYPQGSQAGKGYEKIVFLPMAEEKSNEADNVK